MSTLQTIQPTTNVKLKDGESVYDEYTVLRAGMVDSFKTSNAGIGIGGGLGHLGIGVGGSKGEMVAGRKFQIVDEGKILFTNKRIIFIGKGFVEIPYDKINVINIDKASNKKTEQYRKLFRKQGGNPFSQYRIPVFRRPTALSVLYEGGMDGEEYLITDKNSMQAKDTYDAITSGDYKIQKPESEMSKVAVPSALEGKYTNHETKKSSVMPEVHVHLQKEIVSSALSLLKTIGIVFLVIFFAPIGIPLMFKFMKRPSTKAKVVISVVWGILWLFIIIGSAGDTSKDIQKADSLNTSQQQTETSKSADDYTDAMRKCTVMEAYDIHTTGVGAKSSNAFNDGREHCSSMFSSTYNGDEDTFISDVNTDWENGKNNQVDGKPLTYYLDILGW